MTPASGPAGARAGGPGARHRARGRTGRGQLRVGDRHLLHVRAAWSRGSRRCRHEATARTRRPPRAARPAPSRRSPSGALPPRAGHGRGHGASASSPPAAGGASSSGMPTMASRCVRDGPFTRAAACTGSVGPGPVGGAVGAQRARAARRLAGVTDPPAMEDHLVGHLRPVPLGHERADRVLDLDRVLLLGPAPAPHQASEVGVDRDARDAERVAEDHVGGLAADPGQRHELLERVRQHAVVLLDDGLTQPDQRVGLVPEEARAADHLLELGAVGLCIVERGGVAPEQRRRDGIDHLVGGLRRQDRGDGELQRRGEVELAVGVGVGGGQRAQHAADAPGPPERGLPRGDPLGEPGRALRRCTPRRRGPGGGGHDRRAYGRRPTVSDCLLANVTCAIERLRSVVEIVTKR